MAFDTEESSRTLGKPINLYLFVGSDSLGGASIGPFAYTDSETPITYSGHTYAPMPISRDAITSSGSLDNTTIAITLPQDADISSVFLAWAPSQVLSVFIRQGHVGDSEFLVCWTGRLLGFENNSDGNSAREMILTCEPIATSIRRPGLRRRYQYGCPHVLYGPQCGANQTSKTSTATVVSISGEKVTVTTGWNVNGTPRQYLGGFVKWTDSGGFEVVRRIILVSGSGQNVLTLTGPTTDIGATVEVVVGCNHMMSDCLSLHNVIHNFGGQPWIPKVNPFKLVNFYA